MPIDGDISLDMPTINERVSATFPIVPSGATSTSYDQLYDPRMTVVPPKDISSAQDENDLDWKDLESAWEKIKETGKSVIEYFAPKEEKKEEVEPKEVKPPEKPKQPPPKGPTSPSLIKSLPKNVVSYLPTPLNVALRARQLLNTLKLGDVSVEDDPEGKWQFIAYRKEPHAEGKIGISVYRSTSTEITPSIANIQELKKYLSNPTPELQNLIGSIKYTGPIDNSIDPQLTQIASSIESALITITEENAIKGMVLKTTKDDIQSAINKAVQYRNVKKTASKQLISHSLDDRFYELSKILLKIS